MSLPIERTLVVGGKDYFGLRVSSWTEGEEITSCNVENLDNLVSVENCVVDNSGADPIIKFTATGIKSGLASVKVSYSTANRPSHRTVQIYVNE